MSGEDRGGDAWSWSGRNGGAGGSEGRLGAGEGGRAGGEGGAVDLRWWRRKGSGGDNGEVLVGASSDGGRRGGGGDGDNGWNPSPTFGEQPLEMEETPFFSQMTARVCGGVPSPLIERIMGREGKGPT